MKHHPIAFLLMATALGCDSPSAPRRDPTSPGGPLPATYRVSGLITNDAGVAIRGARVIIDQGPRLPDLNEDTKRSIGSTDLNGLYDIVLVGEYVERPQPVFGLIKVVWVDGRFERLYTQQLDGQGTSAVKNIRLPRRLEIDAGQSIELVVGPDSSLCGSPDISLTTVCESITVRYPLSGTLSVQAHGGGGSVPTIRGLSAAGDGAISFPVSTEDFNSVNVHIESPVGTPAQRYVVSTSFQAF